MALTDESLVLGTTSVAVVLACLIFGLIALIKGVKNREKLLIAAGFNIIITGSYWLGQAVDFVAIVALGIHLRPPELYILISYMQLPFGVTFLGILAGELVIPNYKDAVTGAMSALGFVFMGLVLSFLYILMQELPYLPFAPTFQVTIPDNLDNLIQVNNYPTIRNGFSAYTLCLFLLIFFDLAVFFLLCLGSLVKAFQSSGLLRRKYIYLVIGFGILAAASFSEKIIDFAYHDWGMAAVTILRLALCSYGIWLYLGLRT